MALLPPDTVILSVAKDLPFHRRFFASLRMTLEFSDKAYASNRPRQAQSPKAGLLM